MSLTIKLSDEQATALQAKAAAEGLSLEKWIQKLAEQASPNREIEIEPPRPRLPVGRPEGRKSLAQLFAESPFKGLDIDFERDPDCGRDLSL